MPHRPLLHLSLLMVLSALALAPPVYPQVRFVPPAPVATEAVRAEMTYATNCFFGSDLQLPPGGTGTIKIFAVEGCICPASPLAPYTFSVDLGTLAPGLYPVEVYLTREINTIPCEFEPQLLGRTWLTVAEPGKAPVLDIVPPVPTTGIPVVVLLRTTCPAVFHEPEIGSGPGERLIRIAVNLDEPQPLGPCTAQPTWPHLFNLGILVAGDYRVQVVEPVPQGGETVLAEKRFTVAEGEEALRLHGGRFVLRATWRDGKGQTGDAHPVPLTDETGFFWFFSPANVEVVVKVLNGCAVNDRWWVFLAGLTDVRVDLTVEDTVGGKTKTYASRGGRAFPPVLDTGAFASCNGSPPPRPRPPQKILRGGKIF